MMYTTEVIQRKLTHSQCKHTIVISSLGAGTHTHAHTHTHKHTHTHTHTNTHAHTHKHTCTHTDVCTETIVRNQAHTNLWPVHTWFKYTILCT